MSLRYFSSCFILEFVAIGRRMSKDEDADGDGDDFLDDGVPEECFDLRVGLGCGVSMKRFWVGGPDFGALWLNWERRE